MKLYHCSPTSGLQVLEPNATRYFGKPGQVCLAASLPMALFYGVKHFEYTYGYSIIPRHWRKFIGDAAHLFTFVPLERI